ncbi:MAG: SLBB domain-containing protein [Oscillospiraceae bacterium]|nr:SLBB domain-containing protein [Oscillospiraceae bacterium]
MSIFSKGTVLAQHKEPALSNPLLRFVNPQTQSLLIDRAVSGDISSLSADDLIDIARAAGIVDERDGVFLHRKLSRAKGKAVAVIADAIDDEPYVSSKIGPLLKLREEALGGIGLCCKIAGTDAVYIVAYKHITDLSMRIPRSIEGFKISRLRGGYPARPQASILGKQKGRKLIVGAGALIHLYRAAATGKRQSTVFITVAGNCVANPMNMEVSIGMTVQQILERCGLVDEPSRVVCGGSMTGVAIMDTERTLVTYTTKAVLAIKDAKTDRGLSCIGCSRCERVCPRGLSPMYINKFVRSGFYKYLMDYDAHLCLGCGTCSYICPSRLDISGSAIAAKQYALTHELARREDEESED